MTRPTQEPGDELEKQMATSEIRGTPLVGYAAIKYTAVVICVLGVLYFLATYVIPLLQ